MERESATSGASFIGGTSLAKLTEGLRMKEMECLWLSNASYGVILLDCEAVRTISKERVI